MSETPNCDICSKPLTNETWTDDDQYGDVHVRCLEAKEGGFDRGITYLTPRTGTGQQDRQE